MVTCSNKIPCRFSKLKLQALNPTCRSGHFGPCLLTTTVVLAGFLGVCCNMVRKSRRVATGQSTPNYHVVHARLRRGRWTTLRPSCRCRPPRRNGPPRLAQNRPASRASGTGVGHERRGVRWRWRGVRCWLSPVWACTGVVLFRHNKE